MIDVLICLAVVLAGALAVALVAAARAPIGYEDAQGFHYGPDSTEGAHEFDGVLAHSSR